MCDSNLSAAKFFIYIASYKYYSSVHACAEIISDHRPVIFLTIKVKQYKHTACHIFAEKIPCLAAFHCVADIILGVVFYDKRGAVHECGEVVSRHAVYGNGCFAP